MRVLLQVVFTDLHVILAVRNFYIPKRENLVKCFSSINLRTIKLGKEVDTSISLSVNVSVLGWDLLCNLFGICCFFLMSHVYWLAFNRFCTPPTTMEADFCWELTKKGTLSPGLRWGYTNSILQSRGELPIPINPRPPVLHIWCLVIQQRSKSHPLNSIDPQPPPSSTYMIKKG